MSRPPRLASLDYIGGWRYSLTVCAWQRTQVFRDKRTVDLVWEQFRYTALHERCEITAYCFMPDHAHFLVAGVEEDSDFLRFVRLAKQRSGWRYRRAGFDPLWQEGYYERVLRSDEDSPGVARYILGNPLRAGLVDRVEDYPFWGSSVYSRAELIDYVGAYSGRT